MKIMQITPCIHGSSCRSLQCTENQEGYRRLAAQLAELRSILADIKEPFGYYMSNEFIQFFNKTAEAFDSCIDDAAISLQEILP